MLDLPKCIILGVTHEGEWAHLYVGEDREIGQKFFEKAPPGLAQLHELRKGQHVRGRETEETIVRRNARLADAQKASEEAHAKALADRKAAEEKAAADRAEAAKKAQAKSDEDAAKARKERAEREAAILERGAKVARGQAKLAAEALAAIGATIVPAPSVTAAKSKPAPAPAAAAPKA